MCCHHSNVNTSLYFRNWSDKAALGSVHFALFQHSLVMTRAQACILFVS